MVSAEFSQDEKAIMIRESQKDAVNCAVYVNQPQYIPSQRLDHPSDATQTQATRVAVAVVILFMAALMTPMVFANFSGGAISERENRTLAARPPMRYAAQDMRGFITQFDSWFSDNVGFRKQLIASYNTLIGALNDMYDRGCYLDGSSMVFIGKEGHRFHTHYNQLLPIYQGEPWLNDDELRDLSASLSEIRHYLGKKDIPVVYMLCTDKESVYWEYYPEFVIRGPEPSSLDRVVEYLRNHADIDFFCIKDRLLQEKKKYLVYPKTGNIYELCHYNETGSFFAYQELMKHIGAYLPEVKPVSIDEVNITYRGNGSSEVRLKQPLAYTRLPDANGTNTYNPNGINVYESNDPGLPTLFLLYDSYSDWFMNFLPKHFGRIIMLHWSAIERMEECLDLYKPDIVALESAERAIPMFASEIIPYARSLRAREQNDGRGNP